MKIWLGDRPLPFPKWTSKKYPKSLFLDSFVAICRILIENLFGSMQIPLLSKFQCTHWEEIIKGKRERRRVGSINKNLFVTVTCNHHFYLIVSAILTCSFFPPCKIPWGKVGCIFQSRWKWQKSCNHPNVFSFTTLWLTGMGESLKLDCLVVTLQD